MRKLRHPTLLIVAALALPGCGSGASDKAGGSHAPVVLRLAASYPGTRPAAEQPDFFAAEVRRLSHGTMRVEIVRAVAGEGVPDIEARAVQKVRDGQYDLGWEGARVWDGLGVKSFGALQAPFLITDQGLLDEVVGGAIGHRMLADFRAPGIEGLALLPGLMRHVFGTQHALVSPADFRGARVRVLPSRVSDAVLRSLGATPLHIPNDAINAAVAAGKVDARESSLDTDPSGSWLAGNVTPFAKAITLYANARAFAKLSDKQRDVLRNAAASAVKHALDAAPDDARLVEDFCHEGHVVFAAPEDLAALEHETAPVYAQLDQDPATKAAITAIRRLKAAEPAPAEPALPASCSQPTSGAAGELQEPAGFNGTYRWRTSRAVAKRMHMTQDETGGFGDVFTLTLRDGRARLDDPDPRPVFGSYQVHGRRITLIWPLVQQSFDFSRVSDGSLVHIRPVYPMNRGDAFVMSSDWKRIGPPVKPTDG